MPDVPSPGSAARLPGRRLPGPLAEIAAQALDPGYPRAAAAPARPYRPRARPTGATESGTPSASTGRGSAGRGAPRRSPARLAAVVLALAVGTLLALGGVTQRAGAPARSRLDAALTAERDRDQADVTAKDARARGLRDTVGALRVTVSRDTAAARTTADALGVLEPTAAAVAATGPGLRIQIADDTVGDPDTGPRGSGQRGSGGLTDRDLAHLVNALWAGHATAIAVDGIRLSATSPIRTAGGALLVAFQPVASPYRIDALGTSAALLRAFFGSTPGRLLADGGLPGARLLSTTPMRALTVPAAPVTTPRLARRLSQ